MLAAKAQAPQAKKSVPAEKAERSAQGPQQAQINPIWTGLALSIQRKLAVGAPDDPLERKADTVAKRVAQMPDQFSARQRVSATPARGTQPGHGSPHEVQPGDRPLQPTAMPSKIGVAAGGVSPGRNNEPVNLSSTTSPTAPPTAQAQQHPATTGGRPLPEPLGGQLSRTLGQNLSSVRVHTDTGATTQALNADAFTVGPDITFAPGKLQPGTPEGRRLIAHEVAHTVQQQGAKPRHGPLRVTSPNDTHEQQADAFAESFERRHNEMADEQPKRRRPDASADISGTPTGRGKSKDKGTAAPSSAPSNLEGAIEEPAIILPPSAGQLVTPAPLAVARQIRQRPDILHSPDLHFVPFKDIELFPRTTAINKTWDILPYTFVPLAEGLFMIDVVPIQYRLGGSAYASSFVNLYYGPAMLRQVRVILTTQEADDLDPKIGVIPYPVPLFSLFPLFYPIPGHQPVGRHEADAMLTFAADASAGAVAQAKLEGELALPTRVFNARAFAGMGGSAIAQAHLGVESYFNFGWTNGVADVSGYINLSANANMSFDVNALAGVTVELRFPDIPVVTSLIERVSHWPIIGWVVPDVSRWSWSKTYQKDWPVYHQNYDWEINHRLTLGGSSPSASAVGKVTDAGGFDFQTLMDQVTGNQKPGTMKDDAGPNEDLRFGAATDVSSARAAAQAQIASVKHDAQREKRWNQVALRRARAAAQHAAAAAGPARGATSPPPLAMGMAGGGPADPVAALEAREDKLKDAVASADELAKKAGQVQTEASEPDGPTRHSATGAYNSIADNAGALSNAISRGEEGYARPEESGATHDADYEKMIKARRRASEAREAAFDAIYTESKWATSRVRAAQLNGGLTVYLGAVQSHQASADHLVAEYDRLENDMERASEWYSRHDYGLGAQVFDELYARGVTLKSRADTLNGSRPVGNWDVDAVDLDDDGKLRLKPQFRDVRASCYPHDYLPSVRNEALKYLRIQARPYPNSTDPAQSIWEYLPKRSPRGDHWFIMNDTREGITLDHQHPTVQQQWEVAGHLSTRQPRNAFYNFQGRTPEAVPQMYNSSAGGKVKEHLKPEVGVNFRRVL